MSYLHSYWTLKRQQDFQRLLDVHQTASSGAIGSSSGGRSWNRASALNSSVDVNTKDWLGRTVLHLTCSSIEAYSLECTRSLLAHPAIQVNIRDTESNWTALHRALYNGNIAAALLLLQRSDIDISLKDTEGYTAFDLYNSTVHGTKPTKEETAQLYTWGANRNAALGLGNAADRVHPEEVRVPTTVAPASAAARMEPMRFRQIAMSKLHTAVVTSEPSGNLRVCGFASGGRIGPGQHAQYSLKPLVQFTYTITHVSLGQDHTLALTSSGEVLSWGLNRFSQLGYTVEAAFGGVMGGGLDEVMMQPSPRKVYGVLKKERVVGVAAGKTASVCWTADDLFSWGTNHGQLGYDKAAQAIQITPRKVTKITQPVIGVAITDTAMACLLDNRDVICIMNDRHFKINFASTTFPSDIKVFTNRGDFIVKITSCDETFAALSSCGELFTWSIPAESKVAIKPQRVWALRKQWSAIEDVALGADGSIIVCTQSGHVYVRSRTPKAGQGKAFKFRRVPYIQRVVQVCANNTGAFGILRTDFKPRAIHVGENSFGVHLASLQPFSSLPADSLSSGGEDEDQSAVRRDIERLAHLCELMFRDRQGRMGVNGPGLWEEHHPSSAHGADLLIRTQSGMTFPAHRLVLAARCAALCAVLDGKRSISDISMESTTAKTTPACLAFKEYDPLAVLILLFYLYTDDILAIWDRRVHDALEHCLHAVGSKVAQVKPDLQRLSRILHLPLLSQALESPSKRAAPPSIVADMRQLFERAQTAEQDKRDPESALAADVVLQLADKEVYCHSLVLRARSDLFAGFFDDEDWTIQRWEKDGLIRVNLKHLSWRVMRFVLASVCWGEGDILDDLDGVETVDEALDLVFDVMAAANELLLDHVVLVCSAFILKHSNITNACYVLSDATHLHAVHLVESIQGYMAANLETLLESQMLDDLSPPLIKQLAAFVRTQQAIKSPATRGNTFVLPLMEKHADWLALQDIPQPSLPRSGKSVHKNSPKISPQQTTRLAHRSSFTTSPVLSPLVAPQQSPRVASTGNDDLFTMDDEALPVLSLDQPSPVEYRHGPAWKASSSNLRVDMKTLMAEAARRTTTEQRTDNSSVKFSQRTPQRERRKLQSSLDVLESPSTSVGRATSSPWKVATPPVPISLALPPAARNMAPPRNTPPTATPIRKPATPSSIAKTLPTSPPIGMGPIFTPTRQPSSRGGPSTPRHVSSNSSGTTKAWTSPPVKPIVKSVPTTTSMSFAAIQALQEQDVAPVVDKRSLLEIQQEEQARRAEDESCQAEIEFMLWWQAEEERVKAESLGSSTRSSSVPKQRKPRASKNKAPPSGAASTVQGPSAPRRHNKPRPSASQPVAI